VFFHPILIYLLNLFVSVAAINVGDEGKFEQDFKGADKTAESKILFIFLLFSYFHTSGFLHLFGSEIQTYRKKTSS
jgi:hypothetical protein